MPLTGVDGLSIQHIKKVISTMRFLIYFYPFCVLFCQMFVFFLLWKIIFLGILDHNLGFWLFDESPKVDTSTLEVHDDPSRDIKEACPKASDETPKASDKTSVSGLQTVGWYALGAVVLIGVVAIIWYLCCPGGGPVTPEVLLKDVGAAFPQNTGLATSETSPSGAGAPSSQVTGLATPEISPSDAGALSVTYTGPVPTASESSQGGTVDLSPLISNLTTGEMGIRAGPSDTWSDTSSSGYMDLLFPAEDLPISPSVVEEDVLFAFWR